MPQAGEEVEGAARHSAIRKGLGCRDRRGRAAAEGGWQARRTRGLRLALLCRRHHHDGGARKPSVAPVPARVVVGEMAQ